jgi:Sulfotransferase domain
MTEVVRVAMWSGPRNISTAMMRAWENRPDCAVVDEPLYAAYLAATGADHPGREQVITAGETDWRRAVAMLEGDPPGGARVFYAKHMAHHLLPGMDLGWVSGFRNIFLIRDPREVVASYVRSRQAVEPADIGLLQQAALHDLLDRAGVRPPVVDAADFLRAPEPYLRWMCRWLGIEFTDRMLSWPPGPRPSDGVWARHWYGSVLESTGFAAWRPRAIELSAHEEEVADACRDAYQSLARQRVLV